jgi:hypothetical protein
MTTKEISVPSNNKSLEDVLQECSVDLKKWDVDHYTIEENSKGYNFKVYFKLRNPYEANKEELKKELAEYSKKVITPKHKNKQNGLLLEFAPFDLHWGKLAWAEESGHCS